MLAFFRFPYTLFVEVNILIDHDGLLHLELFGLDHSRPTQESDFYTLGMVTYEVLTSKAPFTL